MAQGNGKPVASVASMVDELAARLQEEPGDAKGWLLLAKSYKHLGRIEEAQRAYKQAAMLGEYDEGLAALDGSAATPQLGRPAHCRKRQSVSLRVRGHGLAERYGLYFRARN